MRVFLILAIILLSAGCTANVSVAHDASQGLPSLSAPAAPASTASVTAVPEITASPTTQATATAVPQPTETSTPVPEPTATEVPQPGSRVTAPILLYHHVARDPNNRYAVSPENFERQMKSLKAWGYTSIPISALVEAVVQEGELPARPVVITFDDGFEDVYENAFPIMQRYGFTGTFYLIVNQLDEYGTVTVDQLSEMIDAGWEIGSHGMTHSDLTKNHASLWREVAKSRIVLQDTLHVPVTTFSYPYGKIDPTVVEAVKKYGYQAAVRLDVTSIHTWAMLYSLSRIEVRSSYDLQTFASFLPWSAKP